MRNERFEWDDRKATANFGKHRVSFELAAAAFDDPLWIDIDDPDPDEERTNRLCAHDGVVFMVTYTERGRLIRIITARKADKHEQRAYDDG